MGVYLQYGMVCGQGVTVGGSGGAIAGDDGWEKEGCWLLVWTCRGLMSLLLRQSVNVGNGWVVRTECDANA